MIECKRMRSVSFPSSDDERQRIRESRMKDKGKSRGREGRENRVEAYLSEVFFPIFVANKLGAKQTTLIPVRAVTTSTSQSMSTSCR